MHKVELIDCNKFVKWLSKKENLASLEHDEYTSIVELLKECVITAENLQVVYEKPKTVNQ